VDIAGLQEVLLGQLNDLRKRLPKMDAYGVGRDDGKARGEFAPIIFRRERFELIDKSTFWLSHTPEKNRQSRLGRRHHSDRQLGQAERSKHKLRFLCDQHTLRPSRGKS